MTQKIYVLDTNVLLHDPLAIYAFKEHKVVIPMTVLEELDHIKDRRDKAVSREARIAIQAIDKLLGKATPKQMIAGVEIPQPTQQRHGALAIYPDQLGAEDPADGHVAQHSNDNRIIQVALNLQREHPRHFVCLVTKDINMRLKAKGAGLEHVEDYRKDRVLDDIELLAHGVEQIKGNFWDRIEKVETVRNGPHVVHLVPAAALPQAYPKMFLQDECDTFGYVEKIEGGVVHLRDLRPETLMRQKLWGLMPRNLAQGMAMHLLQDTEIDLTILTGPAGSGKTLLALACGLHAILEEKKYDKLIIARSTPPIAEDIGFLPGTEEEKMAPWLQAFEDNLEVLHGRDESARTSIEYVKQKANIQFKSLNFMRGRSFNKSYIIIDEAQGLSQFQLKSIITRVGESSKIVILGNLAQIDNNYISPLTSGLTYIVEKFKQFQHAGLMHIDGIERSRLAAFAEENL